MNASQTKHTVLLTGAGGPAISGMIRALKRDQFRVVAVDMDEFSSGFYFADAAYVVPSGQSHGFLSRLEEICKVEAVDAVISVVDEELTHVAALESQGIVVIQPELGFVKFALDKLKCMHGLRKEGISAPETWLLDDLPRDVKYPLFVKPRRGRGSRGCCKVDCRAQLDDFLKFTSYTPRELLAQEFIEGLEYTVSVVVWRDGALHAIVPKEIICKRGVTRIAISRYSSNIEAVCTDIQHKFNANGPFNVQLILDSQGKPWIFEINPRFSTSTTLTDASGINELGAVLMKALKEINLPVNNNWKEGVVLIRSTNDTFITEEEFNTFPQKLSN